MRNYSKVGGKKGKPGYRTPRSFLNKFIKITKNASRGDLYQKVRRYFIIKSKDDIKVNRKEKK
ncbi:hypothetical protein HN784_05115 [bacterium]|jgi:hypothetical protein|nr:hypothetical protein [bacterium]MBT4250797.1 hypothetical protein [bacterium]MBT4598193.1 hypothetical protein [bacterium]MBT6753791.1 hypothetical protein [bacterium]MBT7037496.1 hypothetical protein [bacterium]